MSVGDHRANDDRGSWANKVVASVVSITCTFGQCICSGRICYVAYVLINVKVLTTSVVILLFLCSR